LHTGREIVAFDRWFEKGGASLLSPSCGDGDNTNQSFAAAAAAAVASAALGTAAVATGAARAAAAEAARAGAPAGRHSIDSMTLRQEHRQQVREYALATAAVSSRNAKQCTCRRSRCLRMYCECFKHGELCGDACICKDCHNTQEQQVRTCRSLSPPSPSPPW
jgi:hypothetical protein